MFYQIFGFQLKETRTRRWQVNEDHTDVIDQTSHLHAQLVNCLMGLAGRSSFQVAANRSDTSAIEGNPVPPVGLDCRKWQALTNDPSAFYKLHSIHEPFVII
jgi:hypothetical protein